MFPAINAIEASAESNICISDHMRRDVSGAVALIEDETNEPPTRH